MAIFFLLIISDQCVFQARCPVVVGKQWYVPGMGAHLMGFQRRWTRPRWISPLIKISIHELLAKDKIGIVKSAIAHDRATWPITLLHVILGYSFSLTTRQLDSLLIRLGLLPQFSEQNVKI